MGKQWKQCQTLFFGLQNHCRWWERVKLAGQEGMRQREILSLGVCSLLFEWSHLDSVIKIQEFYQTGGPYSVLFQSAHSPCACPPFSQGHWQDQSTWLHSVSLTLISIWNFRSTKTLIPGHLQQTGHGHNKLNMNTHLLCLLSALSPSFFISVNETYQLLKITFESSYNPRIQMIAKIQRFHLLKAWGFQLYVVYKKLTINIKTQIDWR